MSSTMLPTLGSLGGDSGVGVWDIFLFQIRLLLPWEFPYAGSGWDEGRSNVVPIRARLLLTLVLHMFHKRCSTSWQSKPYFVEASLCTFWQRLRLVFLRIDLHGVRRDSLHPEKAHWLTYALREVISLWSAIWHPIQMANCLDSESV